MDAREVFVKSGPESAADAENPDAESGGIEVLWKNGNIPIAKSINVRTNGNQIIPDKEQVQKGQCTQFYEDSFQIARERCFKFVMSSGCPTGTVNCNNGNCVCCTDC